MTSPFAKGVAAIVGLERPPIGQFLRQMVGLRREPLEAALDRQSREGGRLGEILREQGLITREHIRQALRRQARWLATAMQGDMPSESLPCRTFLSLCLPAYNEEENIEDTLDSVCSILPEFVEHFEVVVVDDGSRDRTAAIVTRYAQSDPRVRLVSHAHNQGYGAAVSTGLRSAQGDLVAFIDSDGQFSMLDLPQLLLPLKDHDVVIGYRYQRADSPRRLLMAWAWNRLLRWLLGVQVRDIDCAFKLFRREVLDRLQLTATSPAINAEILIQCVRAGVRIAETPVLHYPRYRGVAAGCGLKMITRAFRELPHLWRYRFAPLPDKSRQLSVISYQPDKHQRPVSVAD
jgi:hypothetical protein